MSRYLALVSLDRQNWLEAGTADGQVEARTIAREVAQIMAEELGAEVWTRVSVNPAYREPAPPVFHRPPEPVRAPTPSPAPSTRGSEPDETARCILLTKLGETDWWLWRPMYKSAPHHEMSGGMQRRRHHSRTEEQWTNGWDDVVRAYEEDR